MRDNLGDLMKVQNKSCLLCQLMLMKVANCSGGRAGKDFMIHSAGNGAVRTSGVSHG